MSQYHYSKSGPCDKCEEVASLQLTEWGEMWCESCIENAAEAAWQRQQDDLMENGPGPTLLEQQIAARKLK